MKEEIPVLHVIDGNNFANRAYHAPGKQLKHKGKPIGTVYRFFNMLNKQIKDHGIKHLAVAFDIPTQDTFRFHMVVDWHAENNVPFDKEAAYKAGRSKNPVKRKELPPQIELIRELCIELGIVTLKGNKKNPYEADDYIGSVAALGNRTMIHSNDKDFIQLMKEFKVKLQRPKNLLSRSMIKEEYGVEYWQFLDFLALAGDSVDNIPHVKGVGSKTIAGLLEQYGSIGMIVKSKDEVKGVMGKALRGEVYCPDLKLCYKLAKIKIDCPVPKKLSAYKFSRDSNVIRAIKKEYKFQSFLGG